MSSFLLLTVVATVLSGCSSINSTSEASVICNSISKRFAVINSLGEFRIKSYIKNYSSKDIEFVPDEFGSALSISAVALETNKAIPVITPMAGVPMPKILKPMQMFENELSLNSIIPSLHDVLKGSSVKISWDYNFESYDSCFNVQSNYSFTIEKR